MDAATRQAVRERAGFRCDYCNLPEEAVPLVRFHVEHVIARQHLDQNQDDLDNLALACDRCNAYKGTNIASIDPETGQRADLFHPSRHR